MSWIRVRAVRSSAAAEAVKNSCHQLRVRHLLDGRFVVADRPDSSYFTRAVVGRGVSAGDLNNDGRVDLVVVHRDRPAALLYNEARAGHWLGLKIRGTRSGKTPIGTQVSVRTKDRSIVRWLTSGTGYLSSHESRLWIGLGPATSVERVLVKWPSGAVQSWQDLRVDRIFEFEEDREEIREPARRTSIGTP